MAEQTVQARGARARPQAELFPLLLGGRETRSFRGRSCASGARQGPPQVEKSRHRTGRHARARARRDGLLQGRFARRLRRHEDLAKPVAAAARADRARLLVPLRRTRRSDAMRSRDEVGEAGGREGRARNAAHDLPRQEQHRPCRRCSHALGSARASLAVGDGSRFGIRQYLLPESRPVAAHGRVQSTGGAAATPRLRRTVLQDGEGGSPKPLRGQYRRKRRGTWRLPSSDAGCADGRPVRRSTRALVRRCLSQQAACRPGRRNASRRMDSAHEAYAAGTGTGSRPGADQLRDRSHQNDAEDRPPHSGLGLQLGEAPGPVPQAGRC